MSSDRVVANVISLSNSSTVMQVPTTGTNTFKIDLAAMTITIDSTSAIDAIARGFLGGGQTGNPFGGNGTTLGFGQGRTGSRGGGPSGVGVVVKAFLQRVVWLRLDTHTAVRR